MVGGGGKDEGGWRAEWLVSIAVLLASKKRKCVLVATAG